MHIKVIKIKTKKWKLKSNNISWKENIKQLKKSFSTINNK